MKSHYVFASMILIFLILNIFVIVKMIKRSMDILNVPTKYFIIGVLIFPVSIWRNYAMLLGRWKIGAFPLIIIFILFLQNAGFMLHMSPGNLSSFEGLLIKSVILVLVLMIPLCEVLIKLFRPDENKLERGLN
jgi:hypothetical protein